MHRLQLSCPNQRATPTAALRCCLHFRAPWTHCSDTKGRQHIWATVACAMKLWRRIFIFIIIAAVVFFIIIIFILSSSSQYFHFLILFSSTTFGLVPAPFPRTTFSSSPSAFSPPSSYLQDFRGGLWSHTSI